MKSSSHCRGSSHSRSSISGGGGEGMGTIRSTNISNYNNNSINTIHATSVAMESVVEIAVKVLIKE